MNRNRVSKFPDLMSGTPPTMWSPDAYGQLIVTIELTHRTCPGTESVVYARLGKATYRFHVG